MFSLELTGLPYTPPTMNNVRTYLQGVSKSSSELPVSSTLFTFFAFEEFGQKVAVFLCINN